MSAGIGRDVSMTLLEEEVEKEEEEEEEEEAAGVFITG